MKAGREERHSISEKLFNRFPRGISQYRIAVPLPSSVPPRGTSPDPHWAGFFVADSFGASPHCPASCFARELVLVLKTFPNSVFLRNRKPFVNHVPLGSARERNFKPSSAERRWRLFPRSLWTPAASDRCRCAGTTSTKYEPDPVSAYLADMSFRADDSREAQKCIPIATVLTRLCGWVSADLHRPVKSHALF